MFDTSIHDVESIKEISTQTVRREDGTTYKVVNVTVKVKGVRGYCEVTLFGAADAELEIPKPFSRTTRNH